MDNRSVTRCLLFAFTGVLMATSAQADTDYRDYYRDGTAAVESGDFAEAIRTLQLAIGERQEARSGFRRYTPYYYLGVAQMESNDCRAALLSWTESESQGHIKKSREHPDLVERKQRCENQLGEVDQAVQAARSVVEQAQENVGKLEQLSQDSHLQAGWSKGNPSFASRQRQAERLLRDAEQKLEAGAGSVDLAQIKEGEALALSARADLQSIESEAREQLDAFGAALSEAAGKLEDVETGARRVLRSLDDLEPFPPELARRVAELQSDLDAVDKSSDGADPAELTQLQDRLTVSLSQLKRAAQRPPLKLFEAFQAYSVGEYEAVVEILESGRFGRRSSAHACLLKAAARHALFLLDGEQQAELIDAARTDIAQCEQGSAPLEPSLDYFSPKFLAFYRRTVEQIAAGDLGEDGADSPSTGVGDATSDSRR